MRPTHPMLIYSLLPVRLLLLLLLSAPFVKAWRCCEDGKPLEIMDPTLTDLCSRTEALKCVQLGLLCVEEDYTMRPSMSTIVYILSSNFAATALSKPQHSEFIYPANSYKSTIGNHKFTN
ncbi:hypothetical protein KSS87_015246 [Heliosperma pusillum]|nr:hypothetical protein KSS87_015246 [Heliosperma pusillum]